MAKKTGKAGRGKGKAADNRPKGSGARGRRQPTSSRSAQTSARESLGERQEALQRRRSMPEDVLWADLRQGARNVAGVTWQVSVSVHLLVSAHAGNVSLVDLVPEGFEDADCTSVDGSRTFAQMKELDAGHGEMGPAALAEALAHAEASARGSTIAVITDGSLGSGLEFTGWADSLYQQTGQGVQRVGDGLAKRGYNNDEITSILQRAHVVQLPYRVRQASESTLAESAGIHPAVAGIAIDRLTEVVARASADHRRGTAAAATHIRVSDLDAIIADVQDTVDVAGLDTAVSAGVCSPVAFLKPEDVPAATFYLGVDGHPGHVAANLDVIRPDELRACADGLREERSVLFVGPSGCGKSVLLWRAARDLVPAARTLRVDRVQNADDATSLARHVRLLRPTETSPVVVVVDNLGRPRTAAWEHAASLLRELPSVLLLGAARAEDFSPSMLVGATRVVEPRLTAEVAELLGERIDAQGIQRRMAIAEAFERSDGLLMEFVALLTTGHRLRQVLSAQAVALAVPERSVQREAARLVTAAHTLGLGLQADRLADALASRGDIAAVAQVGDALTVLRDEHIAIQDGDTWKGLHELRSTTLSELLHENPPPRIGSTLARVAALVDPGYAGWMLRRVAERHPECVSEVVGALTEHLERATTASELATLLEGAERADNALYVHAALPVLESRRPEGVTLADLAFLTYPQRNQAVLLDEIGNPDYDRYVQRVTAIAAQLPLRSEFESTLSGICAALSSGRLERLLLDAPLIDVLRVLEAGHDALQVPVELIRSLFDRVADPHDVPAALLWSRLVGACARHLTPQQVTETWGSPLTRAEVLCRADPHVLDVEVQGTTVAVRRLLPADAAGEMPPLFPWDIRRAGANNALNEATVACLERLKDACPELQQFQATTVTASGLPYQIADHEPGRKDMPRENFKPRATVRRAVGFQAALRRATASQTWTEIVQVQVDLAAALTAAAAELPLRLRPQDNARRRADWRSNLAKVRKQLGALKPPPLLVGSGPNAAMAQSDNADRAEDKTTRVLKGALEVLDGIGSDADTARPLAIAMGLRDASDAIDSLKKETNALLQGRGSVLPEALVDAMRTAANFAAAVQIEPAMARHIRADDPLGSALQVWKEVTNKLAIENAVTLRKTLAEVPDATFALVQDPAPASWALETRSWVVFAPAEVFEQTLALLETLDDDERDVLGPHIVVLGVILSGELTPDGPEHNGPAMCMSLGFGHQLSSQAGRPALPIPPDRVADWARKANLLQARASTEPAVLLERLVARSHAAAARRLRKLPDPDPHAGPSGQIGTGAATGGPDANPVAGPHEGSATLSLDSQEALALLEQHVAAEESGLTDVYLADVVVTATTGRPVDDQSATLLGAIAALHLANLRVGESEGMR